MQNTFDIAALKEEIKTELLEEMRKRSEPKPWRGISRQIDYWLRNGYDNHDAYKIKAALCALLRIKFKAETVKDLDELQIEETAAITKKLCKLFEIDIDAA